MSYPRSSTSMTEKVMVALAEGFFGVSAVVLTGFIGFLYYEAVRTLLTYGWTEFNISILGFTAFWAIISVILYRSRHGDD